MKKLGYALILFYAIAFILIIILHLTANKGFSTIKYDLDSNDTITDVDDPAFTGTIQVSTEPAPGNPSAGKGKIYEKADKKLYFKNEDGTESDLTQGAGAGDNLGNHTATQDLDMDGFDIKTANTVNSTNTATDYLTVNSTMTADGATVDTATVNCKIDITGTATAGTFTDGSITMTGGNITMPDNGWIGLGAAKGRIIFDDAITDKIIITDAVLDTSEIKHLGDIHIDARDTGGNSDIYLENTAPGLYANVHVEESLIAGHNIVATGDIQSQGMNAAGMDYDKYIVSNSGWLMYRTGAQVRADIDLDTTDSPVFAAITIGGDTINEFAGTHLSVVGNQLNVDSDLANYNWDNSTGVIVQAWDADLDDLADGSLSASKVAGVADADYGDVTVSEGSWTLDANVVDATALDVTDVSDDIAGDIAEGELANSTVISADIKDNTITNDDMADNSIDSDDYVDGSIDAEHLAGDVIDETKIADNGIDSEHYNDDSIDDAHLNLGTGANQISLKDFTDDLEKTIYVQVISTVTALAIGNGRACITIPDNLNGMNLVDADASVYTASTSGTPTVQIHNLTDTADMLSTLITIDANEYSSYTAATQPVINGATDDVVTGDRIRIDVDVAGTGTLGLDVILTFQLP